MKLSFDLILRELSKKYTLKGDFEDISALEKKNQGTQLNLSGVRFYDDKVKTEEGYVYLIPETAAHKGFPYPALVYGRGHEAAPKGQMVRVEKASKETLMNDVLAIFEAYELWDERLRQMAEDGSGLRKVVSEAARKIPCRIIVNEPDMRILADSRYGTDPDGPDNFLGEILPEDIVRSFDPKGGRHCLVNTEPYFTDGAYGRGSVYCMNLRKEEQTVAVCSFTSELGNPSQADQALCQHVFPYIRKAFLADSTIRGKSGRPLGQILKDLVTGSADEELIRVELEPYGSELSSCRCAVMEAGSGVKMEYLCFQMDQVLERCVSFVLGERAVTFFADKPLQEKKLQTLAGNYSLTIGVSLSGDLTKLASDLYHQAGLALIKSKQHGKPVVLFDNVFLSYLCRCAHGSLRLESLVTPGFRALEAYNCHSRVDYLHTLSVYLDFQMSSSMTAAALGINRSSCLKRIDRLRSLLGEELNDADSRFILRWQLYAREEL